MDTAPILAPVLALLHSRKFIVAVVGVLVDLIIAFVPALEPMRDQLITIVTIFAGLLIGGITIEDAAAKYGAAKAYGSAPAAMVVKLQSVPAVPHTETKAAA
jgi:hypothetical protein